ncbi:MAG: putative manganese-dependent inorganic diphosphatase [bacterium]|nr:putative manganese-dependent inorganic diphosphatase [bacterium]
MKEKITYIIGHKNPDTDSIASAIAYASLKQETGKKNYFPARAGKINPQTQYILSRLNIPHPRLISNLTPRVKTLMTESPIAVEENTSLWQALQIMNNNTFTMLPIINDEKKITSILHYNAFAQKMLKKMDPHIRTVIPTSIDLILNTLGGQNIYNINGDTIFQGRIIVAASDTATVKKHIEALPPETIILIVGDIIDLQKYAVSSGVRCIIITGGHTLSKDLASEAEKHGTSVILSPFDTSATSLMIYYSTPVIQMGDKDIHPLKGEEFIKKIKDRLTNSISRSLPVVDDENVLTGVISRGDLLRTPPIELILVDHNELTQAVEGAEQYPIKEIIDHHRLGNIHTPLPITFINRPVGSTSTIIAELFLEQRIPLKKEIASLLLAGIISDTLILRSATTTKTDHDVASYLSDITGLSVSEYGQNIMESASLITKKPIKDLLNLDLKVYAEGKISFSVSQIEVVSPSIFIEKRDEILKELIKIREKENHCFSALMITDITKLSSMLIIDGDIDFIKKISFNQVEDDIFYMENILSRKKQLVPYLTELLGSL